MLLSFLSLLLTWSLGNIPVASSMPPFEQSYKEQQNISPYRIHPESLGIIVSAQSVIAIDEETGTVLFEKNADDVRPLASLTKLWTVKATQQVLRDPETLITMTQADVRTGSIPRVYQGEKIILNDAIALTMIASDNSVAAALMRSAASEAGVTGEELLNSVSSLLRLEHTVLKEPTGLSAQNISTAREVAGMAQEVFRDSDLVSIAGMPEYQLRVQGSRRLIRFRNTNVLLNKDWPGIIAGKTGFTEEAGGNLVVLARNEADRRIIVVVMGSASSDERFQDIKNSVYWVFQNWEWKKSGEGE